MHGRTHEHIETTKNGRTDRKGNIRSFRVSIINLDENAQSEGISRGRTSVHVTQFVTSSHVTILLVTRVSRRAAVLFRALRRCQIIPAGLCHVHAGCACIRTYVPHTLSLPAESRSGANAISTIQTGRCEVTLQRHKNAHRALPPCFNGVSILRDSLFQT